MMADVGIPLYALRRQVASAIDLLVQTDRLASGRRLISSIAELGMDDSTQNYVLNEVFRLGNGVEPQLEWTGRQPKSMAAIARAGRAGDMKLTAPMAQATEPPA